MLKGKVLTVFIIVLFFILAVRTVGLVSNNALFIFDSARDFLFVKKIVVDHHPILIGPSSGGLQGYFQGVIWYYMLAIPFAISGGNPISGQWFMAIMSAMSAVAAFYVIKKIINTYAAFIVLIIFGFAEFSVATSKFVWNPYPIVWIMPFYFLAIYLISKKSKWGIVLLTILQGLILHFEIIYGLGTLPAYLFILYFALKHLKEGKLKYTLISVFLFILPMIPSLMFDLRHQFLITKSVITTISTGGGNLSHKEGEVANSLAKRFRLRTGDLYQYTSGSISKNEVLNFILFLVFIAGSAVIIKTKKQQEKTILLLSLVVLISPFIFFLALKYNVWAYYWIGSSPLYVMLLSFIIGYVFQTYRKHVLFTVLAILLLIIYHPWSVLPYWQKGELSENPQTLSTQLRVVKTIYKDAGGEQFSVYEQTPPVYDYVYRYLLWWQGSRVYNYIPKDEKQKNVYVVLEGVNTDPNAKYFIKKTLHLSTEPVKEFNFGARFPKVLKFHTSQNEVRVDPNFFPQL